MSFLYVLNQIADKEKSTLKSDLTCPCCDVGHRQLSPRISILCVQFFCFSQTYWKSQLTDCVCTRVVPIGDPIVYRRLRGRSTMFCFPADVTHILATFFYRSNAMKLSRSPNTSVHHHFVGGEKVEIFHLTEGTREVFAKILN